MRILYNILTIITTGLALPLAGQVNSKDTIFIKKHSSKGTAQSIYFDNNRKSKSYNQIAHFDFLESDNESYKYSMDYLKATDLKLKKVRPVIPWTKWVTLKQYKGAFYVYKPCDFNSHFRASINDTTYIDWTGEGPEASKIISQKKTDDKTYEFQLIGILNRHRVLIIHIIDINKGIAIFEEAFPGEKSNYYLMKSAAGLNKVPLIVNNCNTHKQAELRFDEPDFTELLKKK